MINFVIIGIVVVIVGAALAYVIKAKKSGAKCIGCPSGSCCSKGKTDASCSSCQCCSTQENK